MEKPQQAPESSNQSGDGESPSWMRGLLVPLCALALLGCAIWLVTAQYDALADGRVQIAVGIVVIVALAIATVLFLRQAKSGIVIDKRNVWDFTRFQWRKRIAEDRDRSER
jgi:purine-cytosine permease-like protein